MHDLVVDSLTKINQRDDVFQCTYPFKETTFEVEYKPTVELKQAFSTLYISQTIIMVYKSEVAINKIKQAPNAQEVRMIIEKYFDRLKLSQRGSRVDKKYTINFLMVIEYHRSKERSEQGVANLITAAEIVRNEHNHASDRLW